MTTIPLACDLSALTDAQRKCHIEVSRQVLAGKQAVIELTDGNCLQFPDDPAWYILLGEFISMEHRCCPFFRLALEVEPGANIIWLHVSGDSEDIKAFIQAEMLG
jgi:hypothetical protein